MAKKGGKKKGKGGGKAKKGKGGKEDEMTLKEAMLAFQIQVKEKTAEELKYEIKGLREKNKRYQQRNERLKEEQLIHIKTLLRQAKEQEQELEQHEVYNSEHVEQALNDKWDAAREEEKVLDDLRMKIETIDEEYQNVVQQVEYWTSYKGFGAEEHKTQIKLLETELEDMQQNFEDMCSHLKRQLDAAKQEVTIHMDHCMAEQKHLASEKAMEQLDVASVQEVHENEWLKSEAEVHRHDVKQLRSMLEELERENLDIISDLLDCQQKDLKISRKFYLTQFNENEVLNEETLHDMDLEKMSVYQSDYDSPSSSSLQIAIQERPRSAMQKAVEDKVFSILGPHQEEEEEDIDVGVEGDVEVDVIAHQDEYIDIYDDKDFLHLGPLEIKLLCVTGQRKPINPIDASLQIVDGSKPDLTVTRPVWPVQTSMMRAAVEGRVRDSSISPSHPVEILKTGTY